MSHSQLPCPTLSWFLGDTDGATVMLWRLQTLMSGLLLCHPSKLELQVDRNCNRMIPLSTNIAAAYFSASDAGQELVLNLALFLSHMLSTHLRAVKTEANRDVLLNAHLYMVKISQVDERWSKLVAELYNEIQALSTGESGLLMGLSMMKVFKTWHATRSFASWPMCSLISFLANCIWVVMDYRVEGLEDGEDEAIVMHCFGYYSTNQQRCDRPLSTWYWRDYQL
ncbi:hypothetical protein EDD22DRAFT_1008244 [Suillus occidentalis]|nr:hypothetical protein EDD22DRAFT_1008244 [Suillus occidentalis]